MMFWTINFLITYPSDMNDLAMTFSDFVNVLKMLICSKKNTLFLELTMAILK